MRLPLLLLLVYPLQVPAQMVPGYVRVETNAPGAVVWADSVRLGPAREGGWHLEAGQYRLTLVEDERAWQPRTADTTLGVRPGDTATVRLDLPVRYRIESVPFGAAVAIERAGHREPLGVTPLVLDRGGGLMGALVLEREGYHPAQLTPGDSLFNRHVVLLQPLRPGDVTEAEGVWMPSRPRRTWVDLAAGAVALAGTGVAIYYKFQADEVDDRYRSPDSPERGDPVLREEALRLDRYSAAALAVGTVSFGLLGVRLILR
ncbi:MAG TPA: hypothetical protein VD962_11215 [Rubricoccaceae bacterium]|nr:hypothetical protein [Rubricoccaceae bacterium]